MCNFSFHLTLVACANSQFAKLCMANYRDWCISGISTICFVMVVIRSPNSQSKKQSQFSVIYGFHSMEPILGRSVLLPYDSSA